VGATPCLPRVVRRRGGGSTVQTSHQRSDGRTGRVRDGEPCPSHGTTHRPHTADGGQLLGGKFNLHEGTTSDGGRPVHLTALGVFPAHCLTPHDELNVPPINLNLLHPLLDEAEVVDLGSAPLSCACPGNLYIEPVVSLQAFRHPHSLQAHLLRLVNSGIGRSIVGHLYRLGRCRAPDKKPRDHQKSPGGRERCGHDRCDYSLVPAKRRRL